jgi:membrane protein YdbS with pleckstrin-like domain
MMHFNCPSCGVGLSAPEECAGRRTKCRRCNNPIAVPNSTSARPEPAAPALEPPRPSIARSQPDSDGFDPTARPDSKLSLMVTEYINQHLMPGERLIAVSHIHPMALLAPGIMAAFSLLLILVGMIGMCIVTAFGILGVMIWGYVFFLLLIERLNTEFSCTDRRILIKSGWLTTQLREMPLGKVEALFMKQGLFGKIFGYGTLVFKGSGGTRRMCKNIESPFDFYKRVQEQVAAAQKH